MSSGCFRQMHHGAAEEKRSAQLEGPCIHVVVSAMRQSCSVRSIGSMLKFVDESRSKNLHAEAAQPRPAGDVNPVFAGVLHAVAGQASVDIRVLCEALDNGGFQHLSDLGGLEATDLIDLVPEFSRPSIAFVKAFLAQCQRHADRESVAATRQAAMGTATSSSSSSAAVAVVQVHAECQDNTDDADNDTKGRAGLILLGESRRARVVPEPAVLAAAVAAAARCTCYPGTEPIGRPREEV